MQNQDKCRANFYSDYQLRGKARQLIDGAVDTLCDRNDREAVIAAFLAEAAEMLAFEQDNVFLSAENTEIRV